jgi:hypothetical protein
MVERCSVRPAALWYFLRRPPPARRLLLGRLDLGIRSSSIRGGALSTSGSGATGQRRGNSLVLLARVDVAIAR